MNDLSGRVILSLNPTGLDQELEGEPGMYDALATP